MRGATVTRSECERMNALADEGMSYRRIATRMDRHYTTIATHCTGECTHQQSETPPETVLCAALTDIADERQRIPTLHDWNTWDDRPCSSNAVKNAFGSWNDALDAAGLAVVPLHASKLVRAAAYQLSEVDG